MRDWQATLFDHGWMIPGYPPELGGRNCTPVQTLIYLETLASRRIPRSGHFPGYAIVAPSLLEFGNDEQRAMAPSAIRGDTIWCIGMSEPNAGSDLAGPADARRGVRRPLRRQRPEGVDVVRDDRAEVLLLRAHRSDAAEAQGHLAAHHRHGHAGHRHPAAAPPQRHGRLRRGVLHRRDRPAREPRRRAQRRLGHHAGFARARAPACGSRASAGSSRRSPGLVELAQKLGRADDPIIRRKIAQFHELASSLRALGYKGFASFAQGSSAPEHSYMKMATSEAGKAAYELGMEIVGPMAPVTDDSFADSGRWSHGFFMSFANTIAGGSSEIQRNIIAQRILGLPRA